MNNDRFCPNCGQKADEGIPYCPNCGQSLNQQKSKAPEAKKSVSRKTPTSKKTVPKKVWIPILLVVLLLIGGYLFGKNYYTKSAQADRLITAIQNNQGKQLVKNSISTDPSLKLNENAMKPLTDYYKNNKEDLAKLKAQFNGNDQQTSKIDYVKDGNSWLIFPHYKMKITPVYSTITTNMNHVALYVNNEQNTKSINQDDGTKIGPLVPGLYHLKAEGKSNGRKLVNYSDQKWIDGSEDVNLELKVISLTVNGENGSSVYISGKKVGQINKSGQYELNKYPFSDNMTVQTEVKSEDGKMIKSKPYKITDEMDGDSITPEFDGIASADDAGDFISAVWNPLDNQTVTDSSSASDNDYNEYFDNGSSNAVYKDLVKMVDGYSDSEDMTSYSMDTEVTSVVPYKKNQTKVNYKVDYSFSYDSKPDREQVFEYQAIIVGNPAYNNSSSDDDDDYGDYSTDIPKYLMKSNYMIKKISDKKSDSDE